MFRGDSMKSIFIILIIFSLFISGCELFEEGEGPQFRMYMMEMAVCDHGENCGLSGGGGGGGRGGTKVLNTPSCLDYNAFMPGWDASCSQEGIYNAPIFCGQELNGTDCSGCYIESTSSYCNSDEFGGCYCIGDNVCNDGVSAPDYGETTSSSDCEAPSHNECNGNNCVSVAGTGTDDCNNPGAIDPMCIVETHLGCNSDGLCEVVPGAGNDHAQCSAVDDQCDKGVCLVGDVCQFVPGAVESSECRSDLDCRVHKACNVDDQCVLVEGSGSDECNIDSDCGGIVYTNPSEFYKYKPDSGVHYFAFEDTFTLNSPASWNDLIISGEFKVKDVSGGKIYFTIDDAPAGSSQGIKRKFTRWYSKPANNVWYQFSTPLTGFDCVYGSSICDGLSNPISAGTHTLKVWYTRGVYSSSDYWVRVKDFTIEKI
jgi:hypothetical protein